MVSDSDEDIWDYKALRKRKITHSKKTVTNESKDSRIIAHNKSRPNNKTRNTKTHSSKMLSMAKRQVPLKKSTNQVHNHIHNVSRSTVEDVIDLTGPANSESTKRCNNIVSDSDTLDSVCANTDSNRVSCSTEAQLHSSATQNCLSNDQSKTGQYSNCDVDASLCNQNSQCKSSWNESGLNVSSAAQREGGVCPFCQLPFQCLVLESPRSHTTECMDIPFLSQNECPEGLRCDHSSPAHYREYRHDMLASVRAGAITNQNMAATTHKSFKRKLSFTLFESHDGVKKQDMADPDDSAEKGHQSLQTSSTSDIFKTATSSKDGDDDCPSDEDIFSCPTNILNNDHKSNVVSKEQINSETLNDVRMSGVQQACSESQDAQHKGDILENVERFDLENDACDLDLYSKEVSDLLHEALHSNNKDTENENDNNRIISKLSVEPGVQIMNARSAESDVMSSQLAAASCSSLVLKTPSKSRKSPSVKTSRSSSKKSQSKYVHLKTKSPRGNSKKPDINQKSILSFFKPPNARVKNTEDVRNTDRVSESTQEISNKGESLKPTAEKPAWPLWRKSESQPAGGASSSADLIDAVDGKRLPKPNDKDTATTSQISSSASSSDMRDTDSSNEQGSSYGSWMLNKVQSWMGYSKQNSTASTRSETSKASYGAKAPYNKQYRQCPFYKKIPGTSLTVDAFNYGCIADCRAYLLSHFHYDHYMGLTKHFKQHIYCSKVTANLVMKKIRVDTTFIHPLPMNQPCMIENVEVTLLEANHCPGAVLFLMRLRNGRVMLHTGDFRASPEMESYPELAGLKIQQLYLDTTYCDPSYAFPPQAEIINTTVAMATRLKIENPRTLFVCGSYTIGKERLFVAVATALGVKVCVTREKKNVLDCLEDAKISSLITLRPREAQVHVLPMAHLKIQPLTDYLQQFGGLFSQIVAFEPTGWTHTNKANKNSHQAGAPIQPKIKSKTVTVYGIPYSEHSSYLEMKRFVQFCQPEKIIPTVNNGNATSRKKMEALFKEWLNEKQTSKQSVLQSWVSSAE